MTDEQMAELDEQNEADILLDAIQRVISSGICTSFVVVASFTRSDGERAIYCNTMLDQRCHETLGLLSYATAIEQRRAQLTWEEDD